MSKGLKYLLVFSLGAAVGAAVSQRIFKQKYEQIADEEIADVKERFQQRLKNCQLTTLPKDIDEMHEVEDDLYAQAMNQYKKIKEEKEADDMDKPYVISPDEFSEIEDYETASLIYYADGILTDEMDEIIHDVDDVVGSDSLNHFGEYEADSVFVRNDRLKCDYEILRDTRNYMDLMSGR